MPRSSSTASCAMVTGWVTTGERSVAIIASPEPDFEVPHRVAEGVLGRHVAQLLQRGKMGPRLRDAGLRRRVGDNDGVLSLVGGLVPPEVVLRRDVVEGGDVGVVQLETELGCIGIARGSEEGAGVRLLRSADFGCERRPAVARSGAEVAIAEQAGGGQRIGDEP